MTHDSIAEQLRPPYGKDAAARILNKVPEVTVYFWIIKVLATTVGETFADFLNDTLGFGLTNTSMAMGLALVAALVVQFVLRKYVPGVYWLTVVLISVVGTLLTDILTDQLGVPLTISTPIIAGALALCFLLWHRSEGTLSIHSIYTRRREAWYWLTVLTTFALGTAVGDLIAEKFGLGYFSTLLIFVAAIALISLAHYRFKLNAILAFWAAYVMTRPLGASIGDLMSQAKKDGGLGLGTTNTSVVFLGAIVLVVVFLSLTKLDVITVDEADIVARS